MTHRDESNADYLAGLCVDFQCSLSSIGTADRRQAEFDNLAVFGQVDRPKGDPEGVSAQRE